MATTVVGAASVAAAVVGAASTAGVAGAAGAVLPSLAVPHTCQTASLAFLTRPPAPQVIMATNRADTLDPALLRPGRLDRKIEFPLPDRRQKRLVFQVRRAAAAALGDAGGSNFVGPDFQLTHLLPLLLLLAGNGCCCWRRWISP